MRDNKAANRFELDIDGLITFATYRLNAGKLYINHVESPMALRGKGAAGKLMQAIVNHATSKNLTIVPVCGYAASWIERNT